ncbi:MAG: 16S rRNA (guanine(966)-N(2))-methyltransferase RsmD [Ignavibacteria bacterium]
MKMRIISGDLKRRLINVPKSGEIRPMTDRVRETLFNLLNNKIDFDMIKVLDLYSGSGALGLECISRGAAEAHFVERNFSIYKNLQENIDLLGVSGKCRIFKMEAVKFSELNEHEQYDLILADPPFFKDDIYETAENLMKNNFLKENAFIVIERSNRTKDKDILNFGAEPFRIIGDACLYEIK